MSGRAAQLDGTLATLLQQTPGLEAAAVVSFDGLPMAAALPEQMDESRVAAMSAALLSLGERAAAGLGRGELSQVYIEGTTGSVFLVSAAGEAVLVAVAVLGAKAGLVLYELRRCAELIGAILQGPAPVVSASALPAHVPPVQVVSEAPVPLQAVPQSPVVHAQATTPNLLPGWPLVGPAPAAAHPAPSWS